MHTRQTAILLYTSVASNVLLAFVMIIKLQTTPSDVANRVGQLSTQLTVAVQAVESSVKHVAEDVTAINDELDRRGVRIEAIESELTERTKDRIFRSKIERWAGQVRELNPQLKIPAIDQIQEAM